MSSALPVKLDRISRLLDDVLDKEGPLPRDVEEPLHKAADELSRAMGKRPPRERTVLRDPPLFQVGQKVCLIVQSYTGANQELIPGAIGSISGLQLNVVRGTVVRTPEKRSPNNIEMVENRPWLFTGDLPVGTVHAIRRYCHVDLVTEIRELFQWKSDHWSTWRSYWSNSELHTWGTYTLFRDEEVE